MPMTDSLLVQFGKESTWGTGVNQTVRLMGITDFQLSPQIAARVMGQARGGFAPGTSIVITDIKSAASFSQEMSYEDAVYWMEMLFGTVTPSGAGPYTRLYSAPDASAPTPIVYTIAYGDTTIGAYRIVGALLNSLTITGSVDDVVKVSGDIGGKTIEAATLAALSDRAVNPVMFHQLTDVFVDLWGGTIGTTALVNSLYGFELNVTSERPTRRYAGQTTAAVYNQRKWAGSLRADVDYNATTKAIIDTYVSGTPVQRQLRLGFNDTAARQFRIDFAGGITDNPNLWDDDDDVATNPFTFSGVKHATLGNWLKIQTITGQATVP